MPRHTPHVEVGLTADFLAFPKWAWIDEYIRLVRLTVLPGADDSEILTFAMPHLRQLINEQRREEREHDSQPERRRDSQLEAWLIERGLLRH